ncbi:MAG: TonB-dependent receptor [Acidobacteria bacterium]|nr:TonB-dependent receptor [Acidobacteriota bacterium]
MRATTWPWLACLCLLLGAPRVFASGDSVLRVHVTEAAGPVATATLRIADIDDATNRREVTLGGEHRMQVAGGLTPGTYDVSMILPDGRAVTERLAIGPGRTVVLAAAFPADAVSLPGIRRIDEYADGEGAAFDARAIRDLPSADNLWSLVETAAPFVVVDRLDTGGLGTGRSALMGSRGESWALTNVSVDGMPVRSPTRTGALPVLPDMNAAAAVVVQSGLAPVELDTPGVVVTWTPRRPGPSWAGGVDASVTTPGMVGENGLPHAPSLGRMEDWRNAAVFAGGPIAHRTGLFLSTSFTRATHIERERPPVFTSESRTLFAHVVSNPTASDQIRILAAFERANAPFEDRRQFADTKVDERSTFGRAQVAWERTGGWGRGAASIGFQRGSWRPQVAASSPGGTMDRVLHGVVPPPAAGSSITQWDGRFEWGAPLRRLGGVVHEVRAGLTLRRSGAVRGIVALPTVAESVAGRPARVWIPVAPAADSDRTLNEGGLFAVDRITMGSRLTVELGVRADVARGAADGGQDSIRWNTMSPRLSFRWSPAALSFYGGVGRYTGGHALSFLAFGDPGETTWNVHRWTDANADGGYSSDEQGVLVARAGSGAGVGSLDPDLRVPRTTEWVAGAEIRPTPHSTLRGAIIIRRQTNLVGVVNTGLSASDYREFFVPDINADEGSPADDQLLPIYERLPASFGRDALRLTNPDADPIQHDGIELAYEIASSRWFMLFGATAYRTLGRGGALGHGVLENDQLVPGDRYWNPNALKDKAGRLFFDRAYVGKWTTAYRAPGDVRLAAVVRYQDGQPFTRYVVAPDLAGGPEITHAYPVGRTRFTYTATVDVRVEKGISLGGRRRASVRLDVFNLTNHANELEEDVLTGPTFRLSSIVQPPRTLRLGVRVEY